MYGAEGSVDVPEIEDVGETVGEERTVFSLPLHLEQCKEICRGRFDFGEESISLLLQIELSGAMFPDLYREFVRICFADDGIPQFSR